MRMSPGLLRARQPYLIRNALTGLALVGFCASVYTYSIKAVKQDDFSGEDVRLLEEEERKRRQLEKVVDLEATILGAGPLGSRKEDLATTSTLQDKFASSSAAPSGQHVSLMERSWQSLGFGRGKEQTDAIIVANAPPIDNLGRIGDRRLKSTDKKLL